MGHAGEKRAEHSHFFALIERFALAEHLFLGAPAFRNVPQRANKPDWAVFCVDDQASHDEPTRVVHRRPRTDLDLEPPPLLRKSAREMLLQCGLVFREDLIEKLGHLLPKVAVSDPQNLMKARREIGMIGGEIPVP